MAKSTMNRSKFKIQRRLKVELPGLGRPGALAKRNYPPGIHGQKRQKLSDYAIRLYEKQKVVFHYGLREKQLKRFVRRAKRISHGSWIEAFVSSLERRLDNIVFRMGWARSMAAARQMVSHGHVRVNGKKVDIASYIVSVGSEISISKEASESKAVQYSKQNIRLELPAFLNLKVVDGADVGELVSEPVTGDIPFPVELRFLIEHYWKA